MEYEFVMVPHYAANDMMREFSQDGWTVHTFKRNPTSEVVDILFERKVR